MARPSCGPIYNNILLFP